MRKPSNSARVKDSLRSWRDCKRTFGGSAAKTLFRVRFQYRQLRRLGERLPKVISVHNAVAIATNHVTK